MVPHKIVRVVAYSSPNPWRYILAQYPFVSYAEAEIKPAKETEVEEKYIVRQIIDKKVQNKKVVYLVWWKKYLKKDATWEPKEQLIEDGAQEYIDEYENSIK